MKSNIGCLKHKITYLSIFTIQYIAKNAKRTIKFSKYQIFINV